MLPSAVFTKSKHGPSEKITAVAFALRLGVVLMVRIVVVIVAGGVDTSRTSRGLFAGLVDGGSGHRSTGRHIGCMNF